MKKIALSLLALTFSFFAAAQKINITALNESQLSKEIKFEGKFKGAYQFTDDAGKHFIIATETGVYKNPKLKHSEDGKDAEVRVYHFLNEKESFVKTWNIYDLINDCSLDVMANFVKNYVQVTDLNKNGTAEIWITYKLGCFGDVSPRVMKIIMHEGLDKYAMRGQSTIHLKNMKPHGGSFKYDQVFIDGPIVFKEYAKKLWDQNSIDSYQ